MAERNNSFDIMRHVAAYTVLVSHHFVLSGLSEPLFLLWSTYGTIAVAVFFSISGYLMAESFSGAGNFIEFMIKRCRRIFPGLIMCSFIMYFIIAPLTKVDSPYEYIVSGDALNFFLKNSVFLQEPVIGVFSGYLYKDVINGSLATLPMEFLCYIIIGLALSFSSSWKSPTCLLITAIITTLFLNYQTDLYSYYSITFKLFFLFSIPFFTGSILSLTKNAWWGRRKELLIFSVLFLFILKGRPEIQIFGLLCISYICISLGLMTKDRLIKGRFDISYGIYIYAFPAQQIIINTTNLGFYTGMILSAIITTCIAILSYKYIEKPFLRNKRKVLNTARAINEK